MGISHQRLAQLHQDRLTSEERNQAWPHSSRIRSLGLTGWGIRRGAPAESATMSLRASLLDVLGGLAYVGSESRLFPHTGHTPGYKWGVELD